MRLPQLLTRALSFAKSMSLNRRMFGEQVTVMSTVLLADLPVLSVTVAVTVTVLVAVVDGSNVRLEESNVADEPEPLMVPSLTDHWNVSLPLQAPPVAEAVMVALCVPSLAAQASALAEAVNDVICGCKYSFTETVTGPAVTVREVSVVSVTVTSTTKSPPLFGVNV